MPTDLSQEVAVSTTAAPPHSAPQPCPAERSAARTSRRTEPQDLHSAASAVTPAEQSPSGIRRRRIPPWPEKSVSSRLEVLRRARYLLAANTAALAAAVPASLPRTHADTLVAEVLPLLAAIKFLEKEAKFILAPRNLEDKGRPFWLRGVQTTVERVPLGTVLILAPYNYPLLLPGVQAMQALAAGNCVVWKPGRGGRPVADLVAGVLAEAGLPEGILRVTEDTVEAAQAELALRPDKILFTGGVEGGRAILRHAAETLTPVVAELSGADAVLVLPTADPRVVADALLFGMRLNGSQTCMAPRRLILVETPVDLNRYRSLDRNTPGAPFTAPPARNRESSDRPLHPTHQILLDLLRAELPNLSAGAVPPQLSALLEDATEKGATVHGAPGQPILILGATPEMLVTRTDLFYPILSVLRAESPDHAADLHNQSRLSLTAAVFGDQQTADRLGRDLATGTVLINDLIVPTADPRIPFGGRGDSGFGVTRGREGLLELTAIRTTATRRNRDYRHFEPTTAAHEPLFTGLIELTHSRTWRARFTGLRKLINAARTLKS